MPRLLSAALCLAFLAASPARAALPFIGKDEKTRIEVSFEGVEGALLDNVRALSSLQRMAAAPDLDDAPVPAVAYD